MEPKSLEETHVSTTEIAQECGTDTATVHNWLKYFRYMEFSTIFGRIIVEKGEYERFKQEHPELVNGAAKVAQVAA